MGKVKRARQKAHIAAVKTKNEEPKTQNADAVEKESDQVCISLFLTMFIESGL